MPEIYLTRESKLIADAALDADPNLFKFDGMWFSKSEGTELAGGWTPNNLIGRDYKGDPHLERELVWCYKCIERLDGLASVRVHYSHSTLINHHSGSYFNEEAAERYGLRQIAGRWYGEGDQVGLQSYDTVQTIIDTTTDNHPYLVGLEVEKEDSSFVDFTDIGEWIAVKDGSLSDGGFELVSPAFNLTKNKPRVSKLLDQVDRFLGASTTQGCGGHINLSKAGRSGPELLSDIEDSIPLLYAMFPKRLKGDYSSPNVKNFEESGKYRAVRVGDDRIEFRIFSRVTSRAQLEWRIRFIKHLVEEGRLPIEEALQDRRSKLWSLLREVYSDEKIANLASMYEPFTWYYSKGLRHPLVLKYLPTCFAAEEAESSTAT
jgi:hypothetical protein